MRELQKEFDVDYFENNIFIHLQSEEEKLLMRALYNKNSTGDKYVLKDRIKDVERNKLGVIFDLMGFIPERRKKDLKRFYNMIEDYFLKKQNKFETFKHIPIEEIIRNAPKYYSLVRLLEQLNMFLSGDKNWLKNFVTKNGINFDWQRYEQWKSGQDYYKHNYGDTQCPSKWINLIQDKLIELLKCNQILLYIEYYVEDDSFNKFLKKNPSIDYKIKANYVKKSLPSENLDVLIKVIDYLLQINIQYDFITNLLIDTTVCMNAYRYIDDSGLFDVLRRKEFFIRYRLEYLLKTPQNQRIALPNEEDITLAAAQFVELYKDIVFSYNEYKARLIEKFDKTKRKLKN
jgi:hypothetical protein